MDLTSLVQGYLNSEGFKVLDQKESYLVADKRVFGQAHTTWLVWKVPGGQDTRRYETRLSDEISDIKPKYPDATAFVLAESRAGFSREFLQELNDKRISLTVPVQFFDAEFKVDEAPNAVSAIQDIRSFDILKERVPQPYRMDTAEGADLAELLGERLKTAHGPTLRIIVGRAGIGKSFLFRVLFATLYADFLTAKRRQKLTPRPIPLMPAYLKNIYAMRTELLVENFLKTDVASPVRTFQWLLVNGFASWLLDGLDELYAGDDHFFEYLADLLTQPGSKAQITVCCRDSLLTTSDAFSDFRALCGQSTALEIYHLKEWDRPSKRIYAWIGLGGRRPKTGELDTQPVKSFMSAIDNSPSLRQISNLPFYCYLLVTQFKATGKLQFTDEVAMLNYIVDGMIQREVNAGLLDLHLFLSGGLEDWLEEMALGYIEEGRYSDIDRKQAIEYGQLVLRDGVDEATQDNTLTSLLRFPLFRPGTEQNKIAFTHDLIAELLAARGYARRIPKQAAEIGYRLSHYDLHEASVLRFIAAKLGDVEQKAIADQIQHGALEGRTLAVLLSLLMLARPERDLIKSTRRDLGGQDLTGVHFRKRDLSTVSFRNSNLSGVIFQDCDLRDAGFEGAFFSRSRFEGSNSLEGAHFGDVERAVSIFVGARILEEPKDIKAWIERVTGRAQPTTEPCPTALQFFHLFSKFVTPLGTGRRDDLPRRALLAGRRVRDAASPEDSLAQAVDHEYLVGPDYRDRFRRAEGDKYAEIVGFMRDGKITDSLGRMIAPICRRRGCLHQLKS
jgi:Pentapeptide repeats (9 copies)